MMVKKIEAFVFEDVLHGARISNVGLVEYRLWIEVARPASRKIVHDGNTMAEPKIFIDNV